MANKLNNAVRSGHSVGLATPFEQEGDSEHGKQHVACVPPQETVGCRLYFKYSLKVLACQQFFSGEITVKRIREKTKMPKLRKAALGSNNQIQIAESSTNL